MSTAAAAPKPRAVRCSRKGCLADMADMRSDALWCSRACYERVRRSESAHRSPMPQSGPSGLQVSYRRAVLAMAICLSTVHDVPVAQAQAEAEGFLGYALSDAQRARLEARQTTCP